MKLHEALTKYKKVRRKDLSWGNRHWLTTKTDNDDYPYVVNRNGNFKCYLDYLRHEDWEEYVEESDKPASTPAPEISDSELFTEIANDLDDCASNPNRFVFSLSPSHQKRLVALLRQAAKESASPPAAACPADTAQPQNDNVEVKILRKLCAAVDHLYKMDSRIVAKLHSNKIIERHRFDSYYEHHRRKVESILKAIKDLLNNETHG